MVLNEKETAYVVDGLDYARVTNVLKDVGIIDDRWFQEYAALRGTHVHTATNLFDNNDFDFNHPDNAPYLGYVNGWAKFRKENPQIEIIESEKFLCSNMVQSAGRCDIIASNKGQLGIIDKKAATTLNPAVEIQTAGYAAMYKEMTKYRGQVWRMAVQLFPDGTYFAKTLKDPNDASVWLSAINLYNWKRKRR